MALPNKLDLIVATFTGDSGLTDYSVSLCNELSKHCQLELVSAQSFDDVKYKPSYPVVKIFRRTRHLLIDIFPFIFHIIQRRPKVLLLQSWIKWPILEIPMLILFRLFGIRLALTVHDLLPHYPKPWSKIEHTLYYTLFEKLIVHSNRQLVGLNEMGNKAAKIVIPHGVYDIFNTQNYTQSVARTFFPDCGEDKFVVVFFGALDERKGILDFINSAKILLDHPNIRFLIAGKGENKPSVKSALEFAKTMNNVYVVDGFIAHEDVQKYFAACDLVALPYHEGTTSGVLKLAMAFKKPIVCTDIGDFSETLEQWPGILLDKIGDANILANGILDAYQNLETLKLKTNQQSSEMQWSTISLRYLQFMDLDNNQSS